MIYSDNAPALEAKLHEHFWERRLNWANDRKEFFRVTIDEIKATLGAERYRYLRGDNWLFSLTSHFQLFGTLLHAGHMKAYPLADELLRPLHRVAMPRAPRVVAPGGTVHVVVRCNNRAFCFTSENRYRTPNRG